MRGSMSWLDFLCLVLATGAAIDAWRNGSLFAQWRARVETKVGLRGYFWADILDCVFCLSHHVPYMLAAAFYLPALAWPQWSVVLKMPLYSLGATRASWLVDGLLPARLRYESGGRADDRGQRP